MAKSNEVLSTENIRTVKEQILDENKLITYISLSKDLCIHVNNAKLLLRQVVQEIREKEANTNLTVNYVISGLSGDKLGRTFVCSESDLETEKSAFQTILFQHIYSVCQGSGKVDKVTYVSLNKFEDLSLCPGLIKAQMCIKRSSDEIGTLKSNSQPTVDEITTPVSIKKDNNVKISLNDHKESNNVAKNQEAKTSPTIIKSEVISPKKVTADSSIGKNNNKNGNKVLKNGKGIAGFFTKSNTKLPKSDEVKNKEIVKDTAVEIKSNVKQEIMDIDEEIVIKTELIKKEPESANKNKSKKNSSLNQIKKNAKVDKKRKRVLHVSDSESEGDNDPFEDEKETIVESDDEIPPTPTTNTVKITSGILNPKKKRKIVDKTYTDEEGYILTRKEEVFESCSEDEEITKKPVIEVKPEKENIKQTNKVQSEVSPKGKGKVTKKKSPPQKGKQGNIMNFFKKV